MRVKSPAVDFHRHFDDAVGDQVGYIEPVVEDVPRQESGSFVLVVGQDHGYALAEHEYGHKIFNLFKSPYKCVAACSWLTLDVSILDISSSLRP